MSSFRNPVGSEPQGVYWRRRLIALGVLLLVVVVIVLVVVGRGGGSSQAAATDAPSASRPAASTRATAEGAAPGATSGATPGASGATPAATAGATPGATAPATKGAVATCQKTQIVLKPLTDATAYAPTQQPAIAMAITNTGSSACHMDLGSSQQVLTITSGTETYWSSKDCQTGGTNQDVTLKAGQTLKTPAITWDRTRSSTTTCDASRSSVPAGGASYHLGVSVGNLKSSTSAQFVLN